MMTQGIPWPIAYRAFLAGAGLIGVATFLVLKHLETRQMRVKRV